jgi:hypothetical protein
MFSPVLKLEDAPKPLSARWPLRPFKFQLAVGRQCFADNYLLAAAAGKCSRPAPENGPAAE